MEGDQGGQRIFIEGSCAFHFNLHCTLPTGCHRPVCDLCATGIFCKYSRAQSSSFPIREQKHVGQQQTDVENEKEKQKRKRESLLFFHLIQLPVSTTTSTKQREVAERVRDGCSRNTVYRFAPHPSRSSKGMEGNNIIYSISKDNFITCIAHTCRTFKSQRHG